MGLASRAWVKPFTKEGPSWLPFNPLKGKREIRERKKNKKIEELVVVMAVKLIYNHYLIINK